MGEFVPVPLPDEGEACRDLSVFRKELASCMTARKAKGSTFKPSALLLPAPPPPPQPGSSCCPHTLSRSRGGVSLAGGKAARLCVPPALPGPGGPPRVCGAGSTYRQDDAGAGGSGRAAAQPPLQAALVGRRRVRCRQGRQVRGRQGHSTSAGTGWGSSRSMSCANHIPAAPRTPCLLLCSLQRQRPRHGAVWGGARQCRL